MTIAPALHRGDRRPERDGGGLITNRMSPAGSPYPSVPATPSTPVGRTLKERPLTEAGGGARRASYYSDA